MLQDELSHIGDRPMASAHFTLRGIKFSQMTIPVGVLQNQLTVRDPSE